MGNADKLHMGISTALRGAGGGGDKQRTPVEAPDSLRSIAYARIIDLLSEGEIVGLADPDHPMRCVFLNETPVEGPDGTLNFHNIQVDTRVGTQTQDYLPNFEGVESELGVGAELRHGTPWVRSITNLNINSLRVRLSVPALQRQKLDNGDIVGTSVSYIIAIQTDGGVFVPMLYSAIAGKTSSKYERSVRLELPPATTGWTLRVTRTTPNADSATVQDTLVLESYTEIVEAKLRMPMSALASVVVDAEQFGSIPSRAYRLKGRIIRVPSNYNPDTRVYTGIWDGTFQVRYSTNPAWVFHDMLLNDRYGLGHLVPQELSNKWELYRIGQYCDQMVPDGFGGLEPRFTCNLALQTQQDALRVMQDMATVFRGIIYAAGSTITAVSDMPEDPVYTYTPANVIGGEFVYSGSGRKVRHTVALVSWNDMSDFCRAKVEAVEDEVGIARYGVQQTEVMAIGCTSRGQARRWGRYILATERLEDDSVAFGVGLDGTIVAPGKIINVQDPLRAGVRRGGRIKTATTTAITVDMIGTSVEVGNTLVVTLKDGTPQRRIITGISGNTITVLPAFSSAPRAQSVWAVDSKDVPLAKYRVLGVAERIEDDSRGYSINAILHVPGKFAYADANDPIEPAPVPQMPTSDVPMPTGLAVTQRDVTDQNTTVKIVNLSWDVVSVATSYEAKWRQNDGSWVDLGSVGTTNVDIPNVNPGSFEVQVTAINVMGHRSQPAFGGPFEINPVSTPPKFVDDIIAAQVTQQEAIDQAAYDAAQAQAAAAEALALNGKPWDAVTVWQEGDVVSRAGRMYRALQASTNVEPPNVLYWDDIGAVTESFGTTTQALTQLRTDVDDQGQEFAAAIMQVRAGSSSKVVDSSFESDSWIGATQFQVSLASFDVRTGTKALRIGWGRGFTAYVQNDHAAVVKPGDRLTVGYWLRTSGSVPSAGATVWVGLRYTTADGTYVDWPGAAFYTSNGVDAFDYRLFSEEVVVPPGAERLTVYIVANNWADGFVHIDDVFATSVSGGEQANATATFALQAAQDAQITLTTNVNGHVSGMYSKNDGQRSVITYLADVFNIISSGSVGVQFTSRAGGYFMRFYAASIQCILGINFGASNNLCFWYGPNVGEANSGKGNGTVWFDNVGSAYFGGSLSAGVLKNSAQSTSIATIDNEVAVGPFTTNGNPRTVIIGYQRQHSRQNNAFGTAGYVAGAGANTATIHVYRRIAGITGWVHTWTVNAGGSWTISNATDAADIATGSWGGSVTVNDSSPASNTVEYVARIVGYTEQSVTHSSGTDDSVSSITQNLSIISTEE